MRQIAIGFQSTDVPLDGNHVTARGLHGLLFHVLKRSDAATATWLHTHSAPKPYTMAAYYDIEGGVLAGIRLTAISDRAAMALTNAWRRAYVEQWPLRLGRLPLTVRDVAAADGPGFEALTNTPAEPTVGLRFLSPTAFRQGPGHLPLPVSRNVFQWPWRMWHAFAPHTLRHLPPDWLEWCDANVFVVEHAIQTAAVTISHQQAPFVGFVGDVWFEAKSTELLYLSIFQGLARLAAYAGVGHKTTMGMGAVEWIDPRGQSHTG